MASGLLVVAGALSIASTFENFKQVTLGAVTGNRGNSYPLNIDVTAWGLRYYGQIAVPSVPTPFRPGIPLVVAGAALIVVALLMALWRATPRLAVVRPLALGCAGIVIGAVWTVCLYVASLYSGLPSQMTQVIAMGPGWPMVIAAASLAALGGITALTNAWRTRSFRDHTDEPAVAVYAIEPETPRYGIPIPDENPATDGSL